MVWESRPCGFCGHFAGHENDSLGPLLGPLVNQRTGEEHYTHRLCALWSPEVYQNESDNLCNVLAAIRRSRALRCSVCGKRGASIGCRVDACHQTFHLSCAGKRGCLFNCDSFVLSCPKHARLFKKEQQQQHRSPLQQQGEENGEPLLQSHPQRAAKRARPGNWEHILAAKSAAKRARAETQARENARRATENESSDDEEHFRRKEQARLIKDRDRLQPVILGGNKSSQEQQSFVAGGWETVGGLGAVVKQLKEMVLFPLVYPEIFKQLGVNPPRGILLHGEPGTGKTLVARALAGACAQHSSKPVAFFARKGADCLGKFSGEAERTLRLLFDEAAKLAPSIIFLDELDGLLPARSTREGGSDQIYASVVTTMLALMDGMSDRGSVVVIAATNRPEGIDPALRRPGRFDREVHFGLPNLADRLNILKVHTGRWEEPPDELTLKAVAERTEGHAGADLKALCSAAVLSAVRRSLPNLTDTLLDKPAASRAIKPAIPAVKVDMVDWQAGLREAGPPCSQRSGLAALAHKTAQPLPHALGPILVTYLQQSLARLYHCSLALPASAADVCRAAAESPSVVGFEKVLIAYGVMQGPRKEKGTPNKQQSPSTAHHAKAPTRCRLLVCGEDDAGQERLVDALRLLLEGCPFHTLNLASMIVSGNGDPCQGVINSLQEFLRRVDPSIPAVVHLPRLETWAVKPISPEDSEDAGCEEEKASGVQSKLGSAGKQNSLLQDSSGLEGLRMHRQRDEMLPESNSSMTAEVGVSISRANIFPASQDQDTVEVEAIALSETWRILEQLLAAVPKEKQIIVLATSTWLPAALPPVLTRFFSESMHGLSQSLEPGREVGGPLVIEQPSLETLKQACKRAADRIAEGTAEQGVRLVKKVLASSTSSHQQLCTAPPQVEDTRSPEEVCTSKESDNKARDAQSKLGDLELKGAKIFAKVAQQLMKLGSKLARDARCKLVVGEVGHGKRARLVSMTDVAKDAESGVLCFLGGFLDKSREAVDAAKACASQDRRYSSRRAAACALWDEILCWHSKLVQDLHLHEQNNADALKLAEVKVASYLASLNLPASEDTQQDPPLPEIQRPDLKDAQAPSRNGVGAEASPVVSHGQEASLCGAEVHSLELQKSTSVTEDCLMETSAPEAEATSAQSAPMSLELEADLFSAIKGAVQDQLKGLQDIPSKLHPFSFAAFEDLTQQVQCKCLAAVDKAIMSSGLPTNESGLQEQLHGFTTMLISGLADRL